MACRTGVPQLTAAAQTVHLCPADGERMERQVCEFVLIDKCPECGGIWLDRGELEIIRDTIENDASRFHR